MSKPVTDPAVAVDALLDARLALQSVKTSTLPGQPLHSAMVSALNSVDSALNMLRALQGAKA